MGQFLKYRADLGEIGKIESFGHEVPDTNKFILCDGSAISRTTYDKLFAKVGTNWGNGNGSTTFHLPDMRGRFPRGKDGGAGNDPDTVSRTASNTGGNTGDAVGSVQDDRMQGHKHGVSGNTASAAGSERLVLIESNRVANQSPTTCITPPSDDGTNGTPRTTSETRSKNVNVAYYIRYKV